MNRWELDADRYSGVTEKTYVVKSILPTSARHTFFQRIDKDTGVIKKISVLDYYLKQYNIRLQRPALPVVETSKGTQYPMEFCSIVKGQRYPFKLNDFQTSNMIKYAVTKPPVRAAAINNGLKALNWPNDPYQAHYGLKIDTKMTVTKARLLPAPLVEFSGGKTERPAQAGRWRIDGKQFIEKGKPLKHWAVVVFDTWSHSSRDTIDKPSVQNFMAEFVKQYKLYGGQVLNPQPPIIGGIADIAQGVTKAWDTMIAKCAAGEKPQLIVCIVNAKITDLYNRLKKNCDCRYGVVSQVMQSAHVKKCQLQYIGNVLMKVNAKLGGFSFRPVPQGKQPKTQAHHFRGPTLIMGADVTHAGPGSATPSMAAVTVSMDKTASRYAAACQSNGHRL